MYTASDLVPWINSLKFERESSGPEWQSANIQDPDGWTNVRTGPGSKYEGVARIYEGEDFEVQSGPEDWWQVRSRSGTSG